MDHEEAIFLKLESLCFKLHPVEVPYFNEAISPTKSEVLCLSIRSCANITQASTLDLKLAIKDMV